MKKILLSALLVLPFATLSTASADDVTCRGTIGARSIDGTVVVPSGATCTLSGTRVDGDVKVQRGGTLITQSARIGGNVQSEGFRSVTVSGGSVGGSIQLKEGGPISVRSVRVNGDIQLEKNRTSARVYSNVVGGNLQCQGNVNIAGGGNRVDGNKEDQCRSF